MNLECFTYDGPNRRTVAAIQKQTAKKGKRNIFSRFIHKKGDKDAIAGWKQDFMRILQIFQVCSFSPA
jgi:hypothetical protein